MEKIRAHVFISGKVQGVFFRENTRRKALEIGVIGWLGIWVMEELKQLLRGKKRKLKS
jgi:acylphosphatase